MKVRELVKKSSMYGWNVKTARYVSEENVLLEFEKFISEKRYHIYILAGIDGIVCKGYNYFEDNVPVDVKTWDKLVR